MWGIVVVSVDDMVFFVNKDIFNVMFYVIGVLGGEGG